MKDPRKEKLFSFHLNFPIFRILIEKIYVCDQIIN